MDKILNMVSEKRKAYRAWYAEQIRLGKGPPQGRLKAITKKRK